MLCKKLLKINKKWHRLQEWVLTVHHQACWLPRKWEPALRVLKKLKNSENAKSWRKSTKKRARHGGTFSSRDLTRELAKIATRQLFSILTFLEKLPLFRIFSRKALPRKGKFQENWKKNKEKMLLLLHLPERCSNRSKPYFLFILIKEIYFQIVILPRQQTCLRKIYQIFKLSDADNRWEYQLCNEQTCSYRWLWTRGEGSSSSLWFHVVFYEIRTHSIRKILQNDTAALINISFFSAPPFSARRGVWQSQPGPRWHSGSQKQTTNTNLPNTIKLLQR